MAHDLQGKLRQGEESRPKSTNRVSNQAVARQDLVTLVTSRHTSLWMFMMFANTPSELFIPAYILTKYC